MWWLWKAVTLAEVSELRQGSLPVSYETWQCCFSWLNSSVVKHKACVWSFGVTSFSQAKGTAGGSFQPSNGVNVAMGRHEVTLERHRVTVGPKIDFIL